MAKNAVATDKLDLRAIATFGCPHNGAAMAETPGTMGLAPLPGQAMRKTASVASISDVLAGYLADETFPGVKDLKPVRENAEYLYGLKQREDALADRPTMLVVGGIANATGALAWLSRHTIGNRSSDLVVEITSSVPAGVGAREERCDGCDHFSYSEKDQRLHYAEDFIRTLLL